MKRATLCVLGLFALASAQHSRALPFQSIPVPLVNADFEHPADFLGWNESGENWSIDDLSVPWSPGTTRAAVVEDGGVTTVSGGGSKFLTQGDIPVQAGGLYELSFVYRKGDDSAGQPFALSGDHNLVGHRVLLTLSGGETPTPTTHTLKYRYESFHGDDWTRFRQRFGSPFDGTLRLRLSFSNFTGKVYLDDFALVRIDDPWNPTKPVQHDDLGPVTYHRVPLVAGNRHFPWNQAPIEGDPAALSAGLVHVFRRDPDHVQMDSVPRAGELATGATWSGAPGQWVPAAIGVRAAEAVDVSVTHDSAFVELGGASSFPWAGNARALVAETADRKVRNRGEDLIFVRALERLVETSQAVLPAGRATVLWLLVRVPAGTPGGTYAATVRLTAVGATAEQIVDFELRLDVANVALDVPDDVVWALDPDLGRWVDGCAPDGIQCLDPLDREAELQDWSEHGIGSLTLHVEKKDFTYAGSVAVAFVPRRFHGFLPMLWEAGFDALLVKCGDRIEKGVRDHLLQVDPELEQDFNQPWTSKFATAFESAVAQIDAYMTTHGAPDVRWTFIGLDEAQLHDVAHANSQGQHVPPGTDVTATTRIEEVGPTWTPELNAVLSSRMYNKHFVALAAEQLAARAVAAQAPPADYELRLYGAGAYEFHDGNMVRNRYLNGFLFWKLHDVDEALGVPGARQNFAWRKRFGESLLDDFDFLDKDLFLTYPDGQGGSHPTPHWEGVRQGVQDFVHAYTFDRRYREFLASCEPDKVEFAGQQRERFDELVDGLPYQLEALYAPGCVDNDRLDAARRELRDRIAEFEDYVPDPAAVLLDGFECGDLAAWDALPAGSEAALEVLPQAALGGAFGLRVHVDASQPPVTYLTDSTPDGEPVYSAGFDLRVEEGDQLEDGKATSVFITRSLGLGKAVFRVRLRRCGAQLQVRGDVLELMADQTVEARTSGWQSIAPVTPVRLECEWQAASDADATDGRFRFRIDGSVELDLDDVRNGAFRVDEARLGAALGFGASKADLSLDDFDSRRTPPPATPPRAEQ